MLEVDAASGRHRELARLAVFDERFTERLMPSPLGTALCWVRLPRHRPRDVPSTYDVWCQHAEGPRELLRDEPQRASVRWRDEEHLVWRRDDEIWQIRIDGTDEHRIFAMEDLFS